MSPASVRVGVIGTSQFADLWHLYGLSRHEGVRLVALCGRNRQRAEAIARKYGIPQIFTDYRELASNSDIDAVVVVTPNNLHYPITMAALEAGKHVLCEKPLGMNLRETQEMYEKAEAAGVVHMVNFTLRGAPAFARMKELMDEGFVGQVYHIAISSVSSALSGDALVWRRDKAQAGSGVLGDLGSHAVDMARWLCGDIARVSAHLATVAPWLRLADGTTVPNQTDDTAALLLEFRNGAQGIVHCSWTAHPGQGRIMHRVEVHGSQGTLSVHGNFWENPRGWATLYGAHGAQKQMDTMPLPDDYVRGLDFSDYTAAARTMSAKPLYVVRRFVDAVLGRATPSPTFYDGMRVQAVLDAAIQADAQRMWRPLD